MLETRRLHAILARSPICTILGPRQIGKSTLARTLEASNYFDLEDPRDAARLGNPMLVLENLDGVVVIDEVQMMPELFPILRVLADRKDHPSRRFVILGSSRPEIVKGASETLAGRVGFLDLGGFRLSDPAVEPLDRL
ncbi:MAG: AAA family ATPase [Spirochaetota bacterium]